ncbi:MAG TPA: FAD-dependent monooxygenase [Nakamurella sp.]
MKRARILIVGAGPAGLATARALTAGGFAPHVVERDSAWTTAGTGMFLPANAFRALRALELDNAVEARAFHIRTQRFLDQRGRVLVEIDLAQMWGDVGPCLGIARAQLHDVLRHGVPVELGTTVRSLEQRDGGPVLAGFADGRSSEYDLVVGADGIHSTVRRLVGDARPPVPVGQRSWRFLTTCPTDVTVWTVLLGRSCSFLMVPLGGGLLYCYADVTAEPAAGENLGGDPRTELRRRFDAFAAPVPAILDRLHHASDVHVSFIEEVATPSWGGGSVVLVGDAAHGMSPNMAQGAALAFEDAVVLAACLRGSGSIDDGMAEFAARRDERTRWVRAQTHRRDRTRNLPAFFRDLTLRHLGTRIITANHAPLVLEP